ncbi:DUF393 domain-containing protein [Alkalimonas collagenimarina]|uniref:DUF393 domain-containing protein n=1 Tax=Alkalimonas collagenimarina TaxID=400390 RepID=A0ABT9GXP9_9GAMM|nr:DUF393 domain-containing protein [Alkalimonas collagenimarina]MDP4535830.1 DUF393 domain-containing protein [Alkalimonas collagenimarina]
MPRPTHHIHHDDAILFYDGSCGLCRKEISLLRQRLDGKIQLQDISDESFSSYQGVNATEMMSTLHLWDGNQFITGLDASLYYWSLAEMKALVRFLRLPGIYQAATLGYRLWARFRAKPTQCKVE